MRDDWVTTGSCIDALGAAGIGAWVAGGLGGVARGEFCAKATELNARPRAVMRTEDAMFIGDTSACGKASGLPFIETAKFFNSRAFADLDASEAP